MLDSHMPSSKTLNGFKSKILKVIQPKEILSLTALTLKESQDCDLV